MIPTRYINAGPMQPKASAGPAMAAGQAVESIGAAITDVGQSTLAVAGKLRKIKEAGAINAFMAQADEEAGRFAIELARRSDTEAWPADWQSRASKLREKAQGLGLSPEAMGALDSQFSNWSSTRSIHFETQAASKELGIARSRTTQALDYSLARGDKEGYDRALATATAGGVLNPAEEEQARAVFKTNEAALDLDRLVEGNPQGVIDTPEEQFLKIMPGATLEQVAAAKRKAEVVVKERAFDTANSVIDRIVSGELTDPKLIYDPEKKTGFAAELRPAERQRLLDTLGRWNAEGAKAARDSKENIAKNVGEFYTRLQEWQPDEEGQDPAGVELRMLIEELPEGHPLAAKMRESMGARKGRLQGEMQSEITSKLDQGIDALNQAGERGDFGPLKAPAGLPVETRKAVVKDKFLQDTRKMQALGYSEAQAQEILEAARENPALGQAKFKELWDKRPQDSVNAAPYDIAVADAIRGENAFLQWTGDVPPEKMAEHQRAIRSKGEAILEYSKWIKANPNAKETEIGAKMRELGSKSGRIDPISGPVKAPPPRPGTETSMNGEGVNPSISKLWGVVSAKYPSVENWGIWGDEKHKARKSDHNTGDAIDIAIKGNDGAKVTGEIVANATASNVKYIIHAGKIWKPSTGWADYSGSHKHDEHVHVSFNR